MAKITNSKPHLREYRIKSDEKVVLTTIPVKVKYKPLIEEIANEEPGFFEKIWFVVQKAPVIISLIFKFLKLSEVLKMNTDKKTTFMATVKVILGIVAAIVGLFGIEMGDGVSEAIIGIAAGGYFLFDWLQGLFTKDKDEKPDSEG